MRLTHSQGAQVGLKANAPALAIPALGDRRARVRPKLRAKAARQGPRTSRPEMALSVPSPHPPAPAPFGARECENVEIGARSQVGLIRHADQEIRVRPGPDRSSPYWGLDSEADKKPRILDAKVVVADHACPPIDGKAGVRPAPCRWRSHTGDWDVLSEEYRCASGAGIAGGCRRGRRPLVAARSAVLHKDGPRVPNVGSSWAETINCVALAQLPIWPYGKWGPRESLGSLLIFNGSCGGSSHARAPAQPYMQEHTLPEFRGRR